MYRTPTRVSMLNFFLSKNRLFKIKNVTSYTEACEWAVRENRPTGSLCGRNDFEKYQMKTIIHQSTRRSRLVWMFLVLTFYVKRLPSRDDGGFFRRLTRIVCANVKRLWFRSASAVTPTILHYEWMTVNKRKIPRATGSVCPDRCECKRVLNVRSSSPRNWVGRVVKKRMFCVFR